MSHRSWLKTGGWGFHRRPLGVLAAIAAIVFLASGPPAHAEITINGNFDSSFSSAFGSNTAAAEAAWTAAAAISVHEHVQRQLCRPKRHH